MFGSLIACPVATNSYTLTGFICKATLLVLQIVPVLVSLALLFFFWGLATFILNSGDTDKLKEGRQRMVWGLVALFFILSISGVIAILMNTFFGAGGAARQVPGGNSSFSQPFNLGGQGSGTVNTPVQVTGSQGGSVQVQGGGEPGFFRRVWCAIGFGSCGPSSNTQSTSGGGGGSGGSFNDSGNQQLR